MIERYACMAGAEIVRVAWNADPWPVTEVLGRVTERTALIAIVSPNNPTGRVVEPDVLCQLAAAAPHAVLMVDCAYAEFDDEALTDAALQLPQAIVLRTFSKAFGLAGLRVGYAMAAPELIDRMRAVGGPYPVAQLAKDIAAGCLELGMPQMRQAVAAVAEHRQALTAQLRELLHDGQEGSPGDPSEALLAGAEAFGPIESQANFVTCATPRASWIRDGLAGLGIAVRAWDNQAAYRNLVRITVPSDQTDFARVTHGLSAVLAPEALLFDLDGVLVDVSKSYREAIRKTAGTYGVVVTFNDIEARKAAGDANNDWRVTHELLGDRGVDCSLAEVTERFETFYQGTPSEPGLWALETLLTTRDVLERLAAHLPLALVTGRPRADTERWLATHELGDLFAAVVCMEDAAAKPSPAPVRLALRWLNVSRAWMIGDTVDDVRAARSADVVALGFANASDDAAADRERMDILVRAGAARAFGSIADFVTDLFADFDRKQS